MMAAPAVLKDFEQPFAPLRVPSARDLPCRGGSVQLSHAALPLEGAIVIVACRPKDEPRPLMRPGLDAG
jgi:hypothetical protein